VKQTLRRDRETGRAGTPRPDKIIEAGWREREKTHRDLMSSLDIEKEEGEKQSDYETRVITEFEKILEDN